MLLTIINNSIKYDTCGYGKIADNAFDEYKQQYKNTIPVYTVKSADNTQEI